MMPHELSISADSISTAAPAGFSITQRHLGHGIAVNVITGTPPGQEQLFGRWDGTQMVKDNLLGRMRWGSSPGSPTLGSRNLKTLTCQIIQGHAKSS